MKLFKILILCFFGFGILFGQDSDDVNIKDALDRKFTEIYKNYKIPLIKSDQFHNTFGRDIEGEKKVIREREWQNKNCPSEKIILYNEFLIFLYNNPKMMINDCRHLNEIQEDIIVSDIKISIFEKIKPVTFEFLENQFPTNELKNKAKKYYNYAKEDLVHYRNFKISHLWYPEFYERLRYFQNSLDAIFQPINKYPEEWEKFIDQIVLYDRNDYQLIYYQFEHTNILGESISNQLKNKLILKSFHHFVNVISSRPHISDQNRKLLHTTISCFQSWPKKHFDYLSLDYYSGFFLDYGRKFEYKDHEKIDPEFSKILDFYYRSLYQNEIFSMRLEDMLGNCQRLAKIPSKEFSYKRLLEKYNSEKKSSTTID